MTNRKARTLSALLSGISLAAVLAGTPAVAADNADLLKRLDALEKRIQQLEGRNTELEGQNKALVEKDKAIEEKIDYRTQRLETVENRAGTIVKPDVSPTFGDPNGNFSFKLRGVVQFDYIKFNERQGGYNYNSGTAFRRARLGAEGDAFKDYKWRFETELAGNVVSILDAYVAYAGVPNWTFTLGQQKAPFGLEANATDAFNTFLERGVANTAFSAVGADRRLGAHVLYAKNPFTFSFAVTGDNESSTRADTAPRESVGVNARATWEPVNDADLRQLIHFGVGTYWRTDLKQANGATTNANAIRLSDRPNARVDGGNIADTGVVPNVKDLFYVGGEAVGAYRSLWVQGEYGRLTLNRDLPTLANVNLDGGYVAAGWFITGEGKVFRNGLVDRLRPLANFNPVRGGSGAWEVALRYDWFDFGDTPVVARTGNEGHSTTAALNWYLNPNMKILFNWVRFVGTNTPLDPVGARTAGDAYGLRLHLDW